MPDAGAPEGDSSANPSRSLDAVSPELPLLDHDAIEDASVPAPASTPSPETTRSEPPFIPATGDLPELKLPPVAPIPGLGTSVAPLESSVPSLIGKVLADRYRVEALLAEGAMGHVFVGEHVMMKKKVAIKVLKRSLTRVPELVLRFEREAMAAANIDHPNVTAATDFGKLEDDSVFLVLEYIEGTSLRDEITRGPLGAQRGLHIARQIAAALSAAHAMDIVHRDLKPENVMLLKQNDDADFVKVLDFGIAKVPASAGEEANPEDGQSITNPGMIFGTPEYMSPQQGLGQEVDGRSDLYSLGVILFEMLTGSVPFNSEDGILGQQLKGIVPKVRDRNSDARVPESVDMFIASMLASDVRDRIQGAKEAIRGLDTLIAEVGKPAMIAPTPGVSPRPLPAASGSTIGKADALVSRLPAIVRTLPPAALIGVPVALLLVVVSLLASQGGNEAEAPAPKGEPGAAASPQAMAPAKQGPTTATGEELDVAKAAGLTVLGELAEKYPQDSVVAVTYARMLSKEQKHEQAVAEVARALELNPDVSNDGQVATVLWAGAQSKARDETFALLDTKMGSKGPDILFDLATVSGVRSSSQQIALKHLSTRQFAQTATPQASIAGDLVAATSCRTRFGLLKRAENVGDDRSLDVLRRFAKGEGCSDSETGECNECLKKGDALANTLKTLEGRSKRK